MNLYAPSRRDGLPSLRSNRQHGQAFEAGRVDPDEERGRDTTVAGETGARPIGKGRAHEGVGEVDGMDTGAVQESGNEHTRNAHEGNVILHCVDQSE